MTHSGMHRLRSISPSPEARGLAAEMSKRDDIMREILNETIPDRRGEKVHESGRTICGRDQAIKGPLARFPSSVELDQCPRGVRGGTWHTHVTKSELRNPSNSLPDVANVVFGPIDVSAVVGTQTMEIVMAASDPDSGSDRFRNVLGADVDSSSDVIDAVLSGRIPNPSAARRRVRNQLGPLFERTQTNFTELDAKLSMSSIPAQSAISFEMTEAQFYARLSRHQPGHRKNPVRNPEGMRAFVRGVNTKTKRATDAPTHTKDVGMSVILERIITSILP